MLKRRKGEPVVILSKRDYDGMIETLHLLNSPANAARLLQSVARIEAATLDDRQGSELKAAVLDGEQSGESNLSLRDIAAEIERTKV